MAAIYHFTRVTDAQIMGFFRALQNPAYAPATFHLMDDLLFQLDSPETERIRDLTGSSTYLITRASQFIPEYDLRIDYMRGQRGRINHPVTTWEIGDPFTDGLSVMGPNSPDSPYVPIIAEAISAWLPLAPPVAIGGIGEIAMQNTAQILNRITSAAADVVEHTSQRQSDLDNLRSRLEEENAARQNEQRHAISEERARQEALFNARADSLAAREAALDDRENTHVRREIETKLANLADGLLAGSLLRRSQPSFLLLMGVSGFVGSLFALAAIVTGRLLVGESDQSVIVFIEATRILLGLGAAACFWFAIRQAAMRHAQIAKWENELHRFRLDTERAAFLIEGDLEARKLNDQGLPEVMLDRFSRGLFSYDGGQENSDPVGHALAHLFNRPAGLEMGPNGIKATVGRSWLRKASKDLDDES